MTDRAFLSVQNQRVSAVGHQLDNDLGPGAASPDALEVEHENAFVPDCLYPTKGAWQGVMPGWGVGCGKKCNTHRRSVEAYEKGVLAQVQMKRVAASVEEDGGDAGATEPGGQLRRESGGESWIETDRHSGKVARSWIDAEGGSDGIPTCLASSGAFAGTVLSVQNGRHLPRAPRLHPNPRAPCPAETVTGTPEA